jgi:ferrous iron transport protein B
MPIKPGKSAPIEILIAGAPNTGKTTVFNALTGISGRVSNYPGVTVEARVAAANIDGVMATVIDLPGIYSLSTFSDEEIVTRKTLTEKSNSIVVTVIDATQLERNLFLTIQLLEQGINVVVALNKIDRLKESGDKIDIDALSKELGVQIVPICARSGAGLNELKKTIAKAANCRPEALIVDYGNELTLTLDRIGKILKQTATSQQERTFNFRALSISLFVGDPDTEQILESNPLKSDLRQTIAQARISLGLNAKEERQNYIDECRYHYINQFISRVLYRTTSPIANISDKIDRWLMSPAIGIPIFLGVMWLLFTIVFVAAKPLSDILNSALSLLSDVLKGKLGSGSFESLMLNGVIGGVGAVLIFVPSIFLLFAGIAILEDTGYLSRAAFIMERVMSRFGMPGKAFMPLILGFGCNVPAIMATRILEDKRDRMIAILVIPFISCSARLPVYILIAGALCPPNAAGTALFAVYLLSIAVALAASGVLRKLMFKGAASPMILEIPPYSAPMAKSVAMHAWRNSLQYMQKAFTFILAGSVILWVTLNFPVTIGQSEIDAQVQTLTTRYRNEYLDYPQEIRAAEKQNLDEVVKNARAQALHLNVEGSIAGRIGKFLEPALAPLGFDWRIGVGLLGGVLAKEIVNSTLGVIFSSSTDADSNSVVAAIRNSKKTDGTPLYTPLTAISLMIFVLLYIPCVATLAVQKKELGNNTRAFIFASTYTTVVAYILSLIVYQGGRLLGIA